MYLSQLSPNSGSFFRSHSDYPWFLTTNKRHLAAPIKKRRVFEFMSSKEFQYHNNQSQQLFGTLKKKKAFSQESTHNIEPKFKVRLG